MSQQINWNARKCANISETRPYSKDTDVFDKSIEARARSRNLQVEFYVVLTVAIMAIFLVCALPIQYKCVDAMRVAAKATSKLPDAKLSTIIAVFKLEIDMKERHCVCCDSASQLVTIAIIDQDYVRDALINTGSAFSKLCSSLIAPAEQAPDFVV